MNVHSVSYMRWAKCHQRVRFELTGSGVPSYQGQSVDTALSSTDFEARGTYGDPELFSAIAGRYGVPADAVLPVPGASSGIFLALATAVRAGDLVLVEDPAYDPIVHSCGVLGLRVRPVPRPAGRGFLPDLSELDAGLAAGARAVFLTNLHNPTGRWIPDDVLGEVIRRCQDRDAVLIVDEAYLDGRALVRGEDVSSVASQGSNILAINTLTKVYGLSGLRMGWVLAGAQYMERARTVMDVLSVNNAGPSMLLAIRALAAMPALEDTYRSIHRVGQAVFRAWLAVEKRASGFPNEGAIFECVKLPAGLRSQTFNDVLVDRFETQVVPGSFFGLDDHVRINTAVEEGILAEGLRRVSDAFSVLGA